MTITQTFAGTRTSHDPTRFLRRAGRNQKARGRLRPTSCGRCGRQLTDPESIQRGYGPECAALIAQDRALAERLPVGTAVRIAAEHVDHGGRVGVIRSIKHPSADARQHGPLWVWFHRDPPRPSFGAWFAADDVELIGGDA